MNMKRAFAAAGLAVMTLGLAGCGDNDSVDYSGGADTSTEVTALTTYTLEGNDIAEYNAVSDPGKLCIAVDGVESVDVECFNRTSAGTSFSGKPTILSTRTFNGNTLIEYVPANDRGKVCMFADGVESVALKCYNRGPGGQQP
jgi:hypothetical protein